MTITDDHARPPRPELAGAQVRLRPGDERDVPLLQAILAEPEVACWWGDPEPANVVAAKLRGDDESVLLVVEAAGQVIGGIEYHEENEPMYRHAGIDIYLAPAARDRASAPRRWPCWPGSCASSAGTTGSLSIQRPPTTGLSAVTRRSASAGWACCASMSAAGMVGSTTAC